MKRLSIAFAIFLILLFSSATSLASAEDKMIENTFTTSKGTQIAVNTTLEHDGLVDGVPSLKVNSTYSLKISLKIVSLGADVLDYHDIAFEISLETDSLPVISSSKSYFHGYYFDGNTRLKENEISSYSYDIFISGDSSSNDATLNIKIYGKENVDKNRDPSSEYDGINIATKINPSGSAGSVTTSGLSEINRTVDFYSEKSSKVHFEMYMEYEGVNNDSKAMLASNEKYLMTFKTSLLELGPDSKDIHDLLIAVTFEDESLLDVIPGQDSRKYYGGSIFVDGDTLRMQVGDTHESHLVFYAATNVNNTNVKLNVHLEFKDSVPFPASLTDPTTKYDLPVEFKLNEGKSNIFDSLTSDAGGLDFQIPYLFFLLALPVLKKRKEFKK